jgi:PrtD family type I secretion system ABC transporter
MSAQIATSAQTVPAGADVRLALASCRGAFIGVGLFSGIINLLALTGSLYMLQVYDRVIPSRSLPTLIGLTLLMLILYGANGALDLIRAQIMNRVGSQIDRSLRRRVFASMLAYPLRVRQGGDNLQAVRDLDQIRQFLSGLGPIALFDMPWLPLYLVLVFALHPLLGVVATLGAVALSLLTLVTEIKSRQPARIAATSQSQRHLFGEANRRNAEVICALGMSGRMSALWDGISEAHLGDQQRASDIASTYGTLSKVMRMVLQSIILGLGAYLVIQGEASAGVIIASSITVSRALAPIEIAIAHWKGFLAARQSYARLNQLLAALPPEPARATLPKPCQQLAVNALSVAAPGQTKPLISDVSFTLERGAGLGIIGPSASGKSSLARALVGAWLPMRGDVRLDGAALGQWPQDLLGRHIGYLPQDIELFDGTIAENIARFEPGAEMEAVLAAARVAGIHELILHLPDGYNTRIGEAGTCLSAGQRQRLGLARALYGDPFLVVLDEPNSNLDRDGDAGLTEAIRLVRARGGIVIVIAHRPSAIAGVDQLLVMNQGRLFAFGPKATITGTIAPERETATETTETLRPSAKVTHLVRRNRDSGKRQST